MNSKATKPIRILHLVTSLDVGGIETMLMNYYRAIDRNKVQFDFLINRESRGFYESEIEKLGGIVYRMCELYPWKFKQYKNEFKDFLLKHQEYKIVHLHLEERSYFALNILNSLEKYFTILHSHNYIPFRLSNFLDLKYPFRLYFLNRIKKLNANKLFAASKLAAKWLFGNKDYEFFANAIEIDKFKKIPKKDKFSKSINLVQIGRIAKQKNIEFSLSLLKTLPDIYSIKFFGTGNDGYVNVLKRLAKQLDVEKRVSFEGIGKAEMALNDSDFLILPSLYEGLGIVAVEAQVANRKVIASNKVPDETDLGGIEFLPLKIDIWKKRILELENSKENFKLKNEQMFDLSVQAPKLEHFYLENC